MIRWKFPSNDHGQVNGINDSGMNYFIGAPLKSLAREICQNSLDAGTGGTVTVEFSSFKLNTYKLPGHSDLKFVFERSMKFWEPQKDKKSKEFFKRALERIDLPKVDMLRISDYNTCGLTGSKEDWNTNWSNLIKASGASDKNGVAGGSFGIGKYAPFACSDFRTVYYNTYDINEVCASQGVSRLVTFVREDGEKTQGIGYYGDDERNTPMNDMLMLDDSFVRESYGTDLFVAGFSYEENEWVSEMVVSIIDDFIGSIWNEQLVVNINNIMINKANLKSLIEEYKEELSRYANDYYQVLTSDKTEWFSIDFMHLGIIKLGLIIDSELNKRVAMIRKTGMKIMDKGGINQNVPFAGVMLIEGDKINTVLRKLENPQHTKWEPARVLNPGFAKNILKNLTIYIRECLEKLIKNQPDEILDAEGIGEFLPDDVEDDKDKKDNIIDNISDRTIQIDVKVREKKPKSSRRVSNEEETEIEDDQSKSTGFEGEDVHKKHDTDKSAKGERHPDSGKSDNNGNIPDRKLEKFIPQKVRTIAISKDEGLYSIIFYSDTSCKNCTIKLYLTGEVGSYEVNILNAKTVEGEELEYKQNMILGLDLIKGDALRLIVNIDYYDYCGMEVEAYGYKA